MPQLDNYKWKMQENINRLSQGQIEYDSPELSVSPDNIRLTVASNQTVSGAIDIVASESVSGFVISDNPRMKLESDEVYGAEDKVNYTFDATGYEAGEIIKGSICIVCNGGERAVPYAVTVTEGDSENRILSFNDYKAQYYAKTDERFSYLMSGEAYHNEGYIFDVQDYRAYALCIDKFGTGGNGLEIQVESPIISFDRDYLEESDFEGGKAIVKATINEQELHPGNNFTCIKLVYDTGCVKVPVKVCNATNTQEESVLKERKLRFFRQELIKTYISYKIEDYSAREFASKIDPIVSTLVLMDEESVEFQLYRVQQLILKGEQETARLMLRECYEKIDDRKSIVYGYYLYLACLLENNSQERFDKVSKLKLLCQEKREANLLLWMRMQVDKELVNSVEARLKMLRNQYIVTGLDCMLLLEASNIFATAPKLLTELDEFEISVMNFAFKCGLVNERLGKEFILTVRKVTDYNPKLLRMLKAMYQSTASRDVLGTVCIQLIKGQFVDEKAFGYYSRAIEKGINVTRLYEYFLYSLPEDYAKELPNAVQKYFVYQKQLKERDLAVLYSNIILYHSQNPEILKDYRRDIESFGCEMVRQGKINAKLSVIYKYLSDSGRFRELFDEHLEEFVFVHKIKVTNERIKKVILIQKNIRAQEAYPVIDGEAYVDVYDEAYVLFGELENENRIPGINFYDEMLFDPDEYLDILSETQEPSEEVKLYLIRKLEDEERANTYRKDLMEADILDRDCEKEYASKLIKQYMQETRSEEMKQYFLGISIHKLSFADRDSVLKWLLEWGDKESNTKVVEFVRKHGIYGIKSDTLLAMALAAVENAKRQYDPLAVWLCTESFLAHQQDMLSVNYLCEYTSGTSKHLRKIWKAAQNYPSIETRAIEEKLLIQMLYSKAFVGERDRIFEAYEGHVSRQNVELAWVTNLAYEAVLRDVVMDELFYERLLRLAKSGYKFNDLCALALIYYFADADNRYTALDLYDDVAKETVAACIRDFLSRKIVLECFMNYRDLVPELSVYAPCVFVEYKANPACTVTLHYVIEGYGEEDISAAIKEKMDAEGKMETSEYHTENMKNVICGVFSKHFVLFRGEAIQYYITEKLMENTVITESEIREPAESGEYDDGAYSVLNEMLDCHETGKSERLEKLMDVYHRRSYIGEHIFKILI